MHILKKIKNIVLCMASLCLCLYIFSVDKNEEITYAQNGWEESLNESPLNDVKDNSYDGPLNYWEVDFNNQVQEPWVLEIVSEANDALTILIEDNPILGAVYLCDAFDIKSLPDGTSDTVATIYSGQSLYILEEAVDIDFNVWAKVSFISGGKDLTGYILRKYIATSDNRFLEWEEDYGMREEYWKIDFSSIAMFSLGDPGEEPGDMEPKEGDDSSLAALELDEENGAVNPYSDEIMAFPESYREKLKAIKDKHPNWVFVKQTLAHDFNTAVNEEMKGAKSLVYKSFETGAKEWTYDGGNWYYASEEILKFYLDPRNALTEDRIFQFEQLTYNEEYHTEEALENYLSNTFMRGTNSDGSVRNAPGLVMTYGHTIFALASEEVDGIKKRNISPYLIASRIIQEQGVNGGSALISGTYPEYEGYYNFFNIGATGSSNADYIKNGLEFAKNHWGPNSEHDSQRTIYGAAGYKYLGVYSSLWYGADFLTGDYISKGQDTLYLQKYNVAPDSKTAAFTHQYMQNVSAPTSEGTSTKSMYEKAGVLDSGFVFKIPVYQNMPEEPCKRPYTTTKLFIKLPDGYASHGVSKTPSVWIDGIEKTSITRNGYLVVDTEVNDAKSAIVYKYDEKGICRGMYVWMLDVKDGGYIQTYEPELEDLLTYHGFSIRITGKSGIRFKTGILPNTRAKLINSGIDGYKLKTYGTVVTNKKNNGVYPFVLNGEKTTSSLSYGYDSSGEFKDLIYETGSEGRYRYTAVLTGLPATSYKNEYAFRGYMILKKGEKEVILYNAPIARSIYTLAQTLIDMKTYAEGTSADVFIKKLISDADSLE